MYFNTADIRVQYIEHSCITNTDNNDWNHEVDYKYKHVILAPSFSFCWEQVLHADTDICLKTKKSFWCFITVENSLDCASWSISTCWQLLLSFQGQYRGQEILDLGPTLNNYLRSFGYARVNNVQFIVLTKGDSLTDWTNWWRVIQVLPFSLREVNWEQK